MKTLTLIGGEILPGHGSGFIETARTIAFTRHEKWDGNGYPARLRGEDIPLMGRIMAVSDVFDLYYFLVIRAKCNQSKPE